AHVDTELNEIMRQAPSASAHALTSGLLFLDQSLNLDGGTGQQNSHRTLRINLGLDPKPVGSGSQEGAGSTANGSLGANLWVDSSVGSGFQKEVGSASDVTSGARNRFGGCGCPVCQGAALGAEAAPQVSAPESLPAAMKAVPAEAAGDIRLAPGAGRACVLF